MRRLSPDEAKLWAKVVELVRPRAGVERPAPPSSPAKVGAQEAPTLDPGLRRGAVPPPPPPARKPPGETLDGSWDRRLSRGLVSPDAMLDLHGHNLATAYDLLDRRLEEAIADGARLLLLVTGKPPEPGRPNSARSDPGGGRRLAAGLAPFGPDRGGAQRPPATRRSGGSLHHSSSFPGLRIPNGNACGIICISNARLWGAERQTGQEHRREWLRRSERSAIACSR